MKIEQSPQESQQCSKGNEQNLQALESILERKELLDAKADGELNTYSYRF